MALPACNAKKGIISFLFFGKIYNDRNTKNIYGRNVMSLFFLLSLIGGWFLLFGIATLMERKDFALNLFPIFFGAVMAYLWINAGKDTYWLRDSSSKPTDEPNGFLNQKRKTSKTIISAETNAHYNKLKEALKSKSNVCFEYTNRQGETATRHVTPAEIYFAGYGEAYLRGLDLDKREERNFKVEKMKNLQILSSSQTKSTENASAVYSAFKTYSKTIFILIGIQASGKSTFARRFLGNCTDISLDQLHTRKKELTTLEVALLMGENCVIDNTNPTRQERKKYIDLAQKEGYKIVGLYFRSAIAECNIRNNGRTGKAKIPLKGLLATAKRLQQPLLQEGFDELYYIKIEKGVFRISPWDTSL